MVVIVDYGVGNLFSLVSSFKAIGVDAIVSSEKAVIESADKIVLPGVGAFGDASDKLFNSGLWQVVIDQANKGVPLLGICLGMQLLLDRSFEYGEHKGLGLIKGDIVPIANVIPKDYKIPHIGWNALNFTDKNNKLFKYIKDGDFVYFVHSFYGAVCPQVTAVSEYGISVTASVEKDNVYGCQFHPEKSGQVGLNILKAFCEI
jgi:glutamine amidotransferase